MSLKACLMLRRYSSAMTWCALQVLEVVTLTAKGRKALLLSSQSNDSGSPGYPVSALLRLASGATFASDTEVCSPKIKR